jgi:putative ABC transport system permease protein
MLLALTVFGVALGIASVLAIQIINRSALAAFRGGIESVSGEADLSVLPHAPTMPDSVYPQVLGTAGVAGAWPLVQATVSLQDTGRVWLDVVGVDLFAPLSLPWSGDPGDLTNALARPGWAAISPALAGELRLDLGDTLAVSAGTRLVRLVVGALVDFQRLTPLASRKLVVMDIAQAQDLLGLGGAISQVDVRLAEGVSARDVSARLAARLGSIAEVVTPQQREQRAEGLLAAFRLNLTALSLVSLVVGLFLVHSSTQAMLVRRRVELGVLRSLGATRSQVFGLILAEVLLLGALGVTLGAPLGYGAARLSVDLVSQTLTNLYLLNEIERLDLPAWLVPLALALGLGGALAGAVAPAVDVSRRDVRSLLADLTLHERTGALAGPLLRAGLALPVLAGAWYALMGRGWRPAGFVLAMAVLGAIPLVTPWLVRRAAAQVRPAGFGLGYSLKSLGVRLVTTSFAAASLAIAVSMLVGVTVMVGSFRDTVRLWVASTLRADLYVTAPSWRATGSAGALEPGVVAALRAVPGVRQADMLRGFTAMSGERRITLAGVDMALPGGEARFPLLSGDSATAFEAVRRRGAVIISEPLARKAGLAVGDSLPVATPRGVRRFLIAGITYDYSNEAGAAAMDLATLEAAFGPGLVHSVALYLEPGRDGERMLDEVRTRFRDTPLNVRSNRGLREEVMRVFDQTFAITRLLQGMALLVAATGITLTLLILARERRAELAVYRALGARRRQILRYFVGKGLMLGALGLLLGLVGGGALALILIFVINRAWFGWTIQVHWPWREVLASSAAILAAALLASLYPAVRAGRAPATQLSRDDL